MGTRGRGAVDPRSQDRDLGHPVPLLLCLVEALVDFGPVHYVPPGGEVVGALVLVLEVVGVLPDVVAEDGVKALAQRRVLIGSGDDFELAALNDEPAPAGAELLGGGFIKGFFEG